MDDGRTVLDYTEWKGSEQFTEEDMVPRKCLVFYYLHFLTRVLRVTGAIARLGSNTSRDDN